MSLIVVTPPDVELLDADDMVLGQHLRLEPEETDNDEFLSAVCAAARQKAEDYTRRRFLTQTLKLRLDGFGHCAIDLGVAPIASITAVRYLDDSGIWQEVDSSAYRLLLSDEPARVAVQPGLSWPVPRVGGDNVEIEFVAGYGADKTALPPLLLHAVRILAAHYYENREAATSATGFDLPFGVRDQLDPWRIWV